METMTAAAAEVPQIHAAAIHYTRQNGTEVNYQRYYVADEFGKKHQVKTAAVRDYVNAGMENAFGFMGSMGNLYAYEAQPETVVAETPSLQPAYMNSVAQASLSSERSFTRLPKSYRDSMAARAAESAITIEPIAGLEELEGTAAAVAVGAVAVDATAETTEPAINAAKRNGTFSRARSWMSERKAGISERWHALPLRKRVAWVGGLAMSAYLGAGVMAESGSSIAMAPAAAATANTSGSTTTSSSTTNPESSTTAPSQHEQLSSAIDQHFAAMNLPSGSYSEVTDVNATFPGNIVADHFSFNHDQWHNNSYSIAGGGQESQDLLNGTNGFTAADAAAARQNLKNVGMPDALIDQLANGDYSNVVQKFYALKNSGGNITYYQMSWNDDGTPKVEAVRTVSASQDGGYDMIDLTAFVGTDGQVHVVDFRNACGGRNIQYFANVTVPTPPTPPKPPKQPTTTTTRPTTTTTHPTTTTTRPTTTTSTSTTVPSTTTTSSTVPSTTTTSTSIPVTTTTVPITTTTTSASKGPAHPPVGTTSTTFPVGEQHPGGPTATTSTTRPETTSTTIMGVSSTSTTAPAGQYNGPESNP